MKWKSLKKLGLRVLLPTAVLLTPTISKAASPAPNTPVKTQRAVSNKPQKRTGNPSLSREAVIHEYKKRCDGLCAQMLPVIREFECINKQPVAYPHLDINGVIQIGYGANIDKWERFQQLDFIKNSKTGQLLTETEKKAYYDQIHHSKSQFRTTGNKGKTFNRPATTYQKYFKYTATRASMDKMCQADMRACLSGLEKTLAKENIILMNMPDVQILALMDIYYNTGNLSKTHWPKLYQALKTKDYKTAAVESHRSHVSVARNQWTADNLLKAGRCPESTLGNKMAAFQIGPNRLPVQRLASIMRARGPNS